LANQGSEIASSGLGLFTVALDKTKAAFFYLMLGAMDFGFAFALTGRSGKKAVIPEHLGYRTPNRNRHFEKMILLFMIL